MYNRSDAWDAIGEHNADEDRRRRARVAWLELWMFPKTCLVKLPGGSANKKRNKNATIARIGRWKEGERATLWADAPRRKPGGPSSAPKDPDK